MLYVDTSVIVKLYIKEKNSKTASDWIKKNKKAIPLTTLHELEFFNALHLKQYRKEISAEDIKNIIFRFKTHEADGIFYRPQIDWPDIFTRAVDLSGKHTKRTGSRSLDILHVASALSIGAKQFFTFDERQSLLVRASGVRVVKYK